ncbi:MAG: D-tyrosyl-tRNA(Tyr) deacylase [Coriobacteriaceae bacterium]|nr:D-tyrosyl-tRNA(Tyr) deacylase [Coriobacteriaceae bacterium]
MRALIQRVNQASVTIDGEVVGAIGRGFLVFLGVGEADGEAQAEKLWSKIFKMRIFPDDAGHATGWALSEVDGNVLVVSQFTLYADCKKGNRPSFTKAGDPAEAERLYEYFCDIARRDLPHLQTGSFGADMQVDLQNDGPFSIWLDTAEL